MGTVLWIAGTLWAALLVYNFITALFGINTFRVKYIELLRWLYRVVGMKPTTKNGSMQRQEGEEFTDYGVQGMSRVKSFGSFKREFELDDVCDFVQTGVQVIVDDEVTHRFTTEEVEQWNFLTRTQMQLNMGFGYEILLWLSILFRFGAFFIVRLPIGITSLIWLFSIMTVFSILNLFAPNAPWKRNAERYCTMVCSRLIAATFTAVINIHNPQNRAKCGSVVVANHTTPIDIVMLAVDNCFTLVGQRHGGFTGIIQSACSLAQRHIWFERKVAADRRMVAKRLKEHISDPSNNPILIFPEGTCINNTGVFMFKKGCFELGATIYPVVIKMSSAGLYSPAASRKSVEVGVTPLPFIQYRREFADPFWNSQEQNMLTYIFMLMTSWAIVCDVYYLEPTTIGENEAAIEFAARVKADICKKGGLVDLPWDGMIKRPGNEGYLNKLIEEERKSYSSGLQVTDS